MKSEPRVGIIIRAKNEEKWITSCLESIFRQTYQNFEIVVVDNLSSDRTVERARKFDITLIQVDEYLPGKAINIGIEACSGEYVVCISAHCIPVNEFWLENLLRNFDDPEVAGVYGRQEPMAFTTDVDKRDLINLFGLDRRVQIKDPFFHNANSMIRRDVWEQIRFDEKVTNIEDRVWAKQVLQEGYKIIYEPEASVYHHHGIHQGGDVYRARKIIRILESLDHSCNASPSISGLSVISIIPVTGKVKRINDRPLLEYTINAAKASKYIKEVIVATDNPEYKTIAEDLGAKAPFLRPRSLSFGFVELVKVYRYTLERLREFEMESDLVVLMEQDSPFRPPGLVDTMVESLVCGDYDTVFAARPEYKSCWTNRDGQLLKVDNGFMPTRFKNPIYVSMIGHGCVTHSSLIYEEKRIGDKVGVIEIDDPFCWIEIKDKRSLTMAEGIAEKWNELLDEGLIRAVPARKDF